MIKKIENRNGLNRVDFELDATQKFDTVTQK